MSPRRVVWFTLIAAAICLAHSVASRATDADYITHGVFAANRLWLLSETGVLSSIDAGTRERVDWSLPDFVLDLWVQEGAPTVLTAGSGASQREWTLLRWDGSQWAKQAQLDSRGDGFVGAGAHQGTTTILTRKRLIELSGRQQRAVKLSPSWDSWWRLGGYASVAINRDAVFVGINNGEWGGGLRRVDRRTGAISSLDSQLGEPVTAMASEPGKEECAIVAVGIVHLLSRGGIYEACGNTVRLLYSKPYRPSAPPGMVTLGSDTDTVAFFGVGAVGPDLWAAGIDALYRVGPDGEAASIPLPMFERIGGARVSFEVPEVVLVATEINAHRSLSGSVPLLVPRTASLAMSR